MTWHNLRCKQSMGYDAVSKFEQFKNFQNFMPLFFDGYRKHVGNWNGHPFSW